MIKRKIAVVEDDIDLNSTIVKFLNIKGFDTFSIYDGLEAVDSIYENSFDLILLDVKLPNLDGFGVAQNIREFTNVPIIFLTSLDGQKDIQKGFSCGADDYIKKPFSLEELNFRIAAICRRLYKNEELINIDDIFKFNIKDLTLYKQDIEIKLKQKELKLLAILLKNKNKTVTKEEIFNNIYEYDEINNEDSLRVFINRLRQVLGKQTIQTKKFIGYKLVI